MIELEKENPLKLFTFIGIHPGKFIMGSPKAEEDRFEDENQVEVEISKAFEMQETTVTQIQYFSIMETNPSIYEGMQKPVQNVSWNDCQEFIKKINHLDEYYEYRLPTEAEWEYACRAGTTSAWYVGYQDLKDYAHFNSKNGPLPVKSKLPNDWGLYAMHGNVWEWCNDWYDSTLNGGVNPKGPNYGSLRVVRGGSWYNNAQFLRSAERGNDDPGNRYDALGFRLVRTPINLDTLTLVPLSKTREAKVEAILEKLKELKTEIEELK